MKVYIVMICRAGQEGGNPIYAYSTRERAEKKVELLNRQSADHGDLFTYAKVIELPLDVDGKKRGLP